MGSEYRQSQEQTYTHPPQFSFVNKTFSEVLT